MTRLLREWSNGDEQARDRLVAIVYGDLRRRAQRIMSEERAEYTIDTTGLVHEVYLRLFDQRLASVHNRSHLLAIAARVMRRILVEHARARNADKRGAGWRRITMDLAVEMLPAGPLEVLDVSAAIEALVVLDELQSKIVELRFFGGLSIAEAADALGVSPATVKREWHMARAWLSRRLGAA